MQTLTVKLAEQSTLIDKINRERVESEEKHAREIEEVTDQGVCEISELETKIDEEQEKSENLKAQME